MIFFKSLFRRQKPWQEEIQILYKDLVPISGEAETLQGELVRSIQNLADECQRNGWMNWDEANEEEIELLKRFLPNADLFPESDRKPILSKLDQIAYCGEKGADEGKFGYEEIKFIAEKVVVWCRHQKKMIHKQPDETWLEYET